MKLNKFALTLSVAALLPTFAFAGADAVVTSFERDLQRDITVQSLAVARTDADPLVNAINAALHNTSDAVVASFERDLNREPTVSPNIFVASVDPLVEAINIAFYGTSDTVLASFERDLNREPTV